MYFGQVVSMNPKRNSVKLSAFYNEEDEARCCCMRNAVCPASSSTSLSTLCALQGWQKLCCTQPGNNQ